MLLAAFIMIKTPHWHLLVLILAITIFHNGLVFGIPVEHLSSTRFVKDTLPERKPAGLYTKPKVVSIPRVHTPILIDGLFREKSWQRIKWSDAFVDISGTSVKKLNRQDHEEKILSSRMKMCWDDQYVYIAAELKDPDLYATLRQSDTIIYNDNDFEVFLLPGTDLNAPYYEIEINQLGTVLDLLMARPYRNGGKALINFDLKGIKTAVHLVGTLNDPQDRDTGWQLEIAIPFKAILSYGQPLPEKGDYWRVNFSRVQWDLLQKGKVYQRKHIGGRLAPEHNWVWSPQGMINMHAPDRWGYLYFSDQDSDNPPELPLAELEKLALWNIYYKQWDVFRQQKKFALTLGALGVRNRLKIDTAGPLSSRDYRLRLQSDDHWFRVELCDDHGNALRSLNQNGMMQSLL